MTLDMAIVNEKHKYLINNLDLMARKIKSQDFYELLEVGRSKDLNFYLIKRPNVHRYTHCELQCLHFELECYSCKEITNFITISKYFLHLLY